MFVMLRMRASVTLELKAFQELKPIAGVLPTPLSYAAGSNCMASAHGTPTALSIVSVDICATHHTPRQAAMLLHQQPVPKYLRMSPFALFLTMLHSPPSGGHFGARAGVLHVLTRARAMYTRINDG